MAEVERAVNKGIPIIPFRIENVMPSKAMEFFLSARHWLDALTPPLEKHLHRLADTVQVLLTAELEKLRAPSTERELALPTPKPTPTITVYDINTHTAKAGDTITFSYTIYNPSSSSQNVGLGASITLGSTWINDSANDIVVSVGPGTSITTRSFKISTMAAVGTYDVYWGIWSGTPGFSTQYQGVSHSQYLTISPPPKPPVKAKWWRKVKRVHILTSSLVIALIAVGVFFLVDWLGRQEEIPGDTLPTNHSASALTSGTSLKGELTYAGEVHWYTFDAEAGDVVYIVLTDGTKNSPMYPWLGLLGPDGNIVSENYYSESFNIDRMLPTTGRYTIRVRDHSLGTGSYVLSFSQLSKADNPISSGASIQGQLEFPGEVHWYTFDAEAGDTIYIVLTEGTKNSPMYPWLGLLGPDGNIVSENYYSESFNIDRVLAATGRYTIRVRDHALVGGSYTLSFNMVVEP
jgi:hypothetical protein